MTLKTLLGAIQDTKIGASLVVSDRGRLQAVTQIVTSSRVVMLICRPRPRWEATAPENSATGSNPSAKPQPSTGTTCGTAFEGKTKWGTTQ